jgi:hypothetical protein
MSCNHTLTEQHAARKVIHYTRQCTVSCSLHYHARSCEQSALEYQLYTGHAAQLICIQSALVSAYLKDREALANAAQLRNHVCTLLHLHHLLLKHTAICRAMSRTGKMISINQPINRYYVYMYCMCRPLQQQSCASNRCTKCAHLQQCG